MAKKKRTHKSKEQLSDENEFLKMKMMAEYGGDFVGNEKIPPEVENRFLKQIMNFQKKHASSQITTVYNYLGRPEYNLVNDLSDREIPRELKRVIRLMKRKGIGLDVLAPTPEREIYRFITEELFKQPIEDIHLKGWTTQFVYEEFHPNVEYDVKNAVHFTLGILFNHPAVYPGDGAFSEEMKDHIGLSTDPEEFMEKVRAFQQQFYTVTLVHYDILSLTIEPDSQHARAEVDVTYKTQKEKGKRSKRHNETVELYLERHEDGFSLWEVSRVVCTLF